MACLGNLTQVPRSSSTSRILRFPGWNREREDTPVGPHTVNVRTVRASAARTRRSVFCHVASKTPPQLLPPKTEVTEPSPSSASSARTEKRGFRFHGFSGCPRIEIREIGPNPSSNSPHSSICGSILENTLALPVLVTVVGFLTVFLRCGLEVVEELMPVWVFGPLIVAVYAKAFRAIGRLYVAWFEQAATDFPASCLAAYDYVNDAARVRDDVMRPLLAVWAFDYAAFVRNAFGGLKEFAFDRYYDFIESVWPFYYRAVRFLKKADLL